MAEKSRPEVVGTTIAGRYEVDRLLGEGGMGSVYLAHDLELNRRPVVLKFPDPAGLADPNFRERFRFEIRSLAALDHPHIIKIYDSGEYGEIPYAVVQYAGGGDLKNRLRQATSTPEEILPWFQVVADALDFVHRHGYCHRDVKPANIFLDDAGYAYLSDFGIATAMARPDAADDNSELTRKGFFVGSARYGPPEAMRRTISPAYDQYSLAVTVYEALSGRVPIERDTAMDLLISKAHDPPRDIRDFVPELPGASADALMRALSIDPQQRFASCADFFDAFADGLPGDVFGARRWPAILAAAAASALAVAGLAWMFRAEPGPPTIERPPAPLVVESLHRVQLGSTEAEFSDGIDLCRRYDPNCDASWFTDEAIRSVVLAPYALDLYEVSNREFGAFIDESSRQTTAEKRGSSYHRYVKVPGLTWDEPAPGREASAHADDPVVHVSWFDAEAFCNAAQMRLPTEDEWEFAARGDERRMFPWGNAWDEKNASWGQPDIDGLQHVDSHSAGATPLGHQHLSGNVAEWTSTPIGGEKVIKGGSWQDENPARLRPSARSAESPDYSSSDLGFRCLREPTATPPAKP